MRVTAFLLAFLALLGPMTAAAPVDSGRLLTLERHPLAKLGEEPLHLQVEPVLQSLYGSCGEAAIAMAYNYARPASPLEERVIIEYARQQGYFTEYRPPYTTPADMVRIARHFARGVVSGNVVNSSQGWAVLTTHLQQGEPVIIDIRARLYDLDSPAHFVIVTGISSDPKRGNAVRINYNDPLTGTRESARWSSNEGIWNTWHDNGDPGGSGWWMVIPRL